MNNNEETKIASLNSSCREELMDVPLAKLPEYKIASKEITIEETEEIKKQKKLIESYKAEYSQTKTRNGVLANVLKKRVLTPAELERREELSARSKKVEMQQKHGIEKNTKPVYISEVEDEELYTLQREGFKDEKEQRFAHDSRGIDDVYYYSSPQKTLGVGVSVVEDVDQRTTTSKEDIPSGLPVTIVISKQDPLELTLARCQEKPVYIVQGMPTVSGGNVEYGLMGLEEQLWIRSSIQCSINETIQASYYPLLPSATIYSPQIYVFGKSIEHGFGLDPELLSRGRGAMISAITVGTLQRKVVEDKDGKDLEDYAEKELPKDEQDTIIEKYHASFATAAYHGHKHVILTPIGIYLYPRNCVILIKLLRDAIFNSTHGWNRRFASITICAPPGYLQGIFDTYILDKLRKAFA